MFLTPSNSTMGGLLPHFFVLKIKGVNYMLSSWNFIYKYIGHSYVHWMQKIIWPSAARSPYGGYFHGSQPQKCDNRPYLKNRVPIIGILQKLAWKFSLATETVLKKDRTIETFLAAKMTSSFSTFSYKKTSTAAIYLKIGRIVDFDVKKPENKFQASSAIFDMTSWLTRVIFY